MPKTKGMITIENFDTDKWKITLDVLAMAEASANGDVEKIVKQTFEMHTKKKMTDFSISETFDDVDWQSIYILSPRK